MTKLNKHRDCYDNLITLGLENIVQENKKDIKFFRLSEPMTDYYLYIYHDGIPILARIDNNKLIGLLELIENERLEVKTKVIFHLDFFKEVCKYYDSELDKPDF